MSEIKKKSTLSLRWRVIFSIILLLLFIVGTFSFLTVNSIHSLIEELMWESYSAYAESFADFSARSFAERDIEELERHLDIAFTQMHMLFVVAKDLNGKIIASSGDFNQYEPFQIHKNIFTNEKVEVQEIGHEPGGLFHSAGHNFLITADLSFEGQHLGFIQLAMTTASANRRLATISLWGFKMAFAVVALGMIILIFVDRRLKKNISRLIQITHSMAIGDLSERVEIKTGDEIEQLGESFNMMAEAIRKHEEQLEHLVRQRTGELAEEKNKLELILDNVPSAFLMHDNNLKVETVSSQFEAVLDKKREEVIGKVCALEPLLYQGNEPCPSREALKSGRIQRCEAQVLSRNGGDKFIEHISIPIKQRGEIIKVLDLITDVSDRKRFEDQLVRTEKLSATGEMAAIIAHEMRNSLSSVNLTLQVMTDAFGKDDEETQALEVAITAVNRMETIVRQLLEFAKPTEVKFQTSDINSLILQSLDFCRYQVQKKQISVKHNLASNIPPIDLDVELIREVLINLILNAVAAVNEKGQISLTSEIIVLENTLRDTFDHQNITMKKGERVICISIADNGRGISKQDLERIFDPFFSTTSRGTGLGLTMSKRAIVQHQGILLVDSRFGKGSIFSIHLTLPRGVDVLEQQ